ncbi:MAG TPA: AMP-binding protein, partial [Acidimicrobiia bacterium]|nr:AMP-binding protein [Acidimicrobiia bacterium]
RTLASKALTMRRVHGLTPEDSVLMPAPLAHVSGLLNGVLVPGVVAMKTVLMQRWSPEAALDLVEREGVSFMVGPPTFFVGMMEAEGFSPERVATLRLVSSGGAGVTAAFVERAGERLGALVKRTYGSTEAPTVTTSHAGDDPNRARTSDGRSTGDAELRVVDPATGAPRPVGEPGELWVRGPELCAGYLDAGATAEAFTDDGWFRTGDLAVVDADGWLTIVGRLKDVIIRGGENISASEVESTLEAHPAVSQAVAVGMPDDRLGERVVAFVVASDPFDLETCRAWFEERGVARFKTPERVEVVDALPLLASGKPDRAALRSRLLGSPDTA